MEDFRRTCAVHLFCLSTFIPSLFGSVDTSFEFCFEYIILNKTRILCHLLN